MRLTCDVELTDDRLRNLPRALWGRGQRLVDRTAFAVEREAKLRAPVDTGFLRNSIYTVTTSTSGYDEALRVAERLEARRHAGQRRDRAGRWVDVAGEMLEETRGPGFLAAIVAVGAEYGVWVEYGTARQAAQPYLEPAIEAVRASWERGLAELFARAVGDAGVAAQ